MSGVAVCNAEIATLKDTYFADNEAGVKRATTTRCDMDHLFCSSSLEKYSLSSISQTLDG